MIYFVFRLDLGALLQKPSNDTESAFISQFNQQATESIKNSIGVSCLTEDVVIMLKLFVKLSLTWNIFICGKNGKNKMRLVREILYHLLKKTWKGLALCIYSLLNRLVLGTEHSILVRRPVDLPSVAARWQVLLWPITCSHQLCPLSSPAPCPVTSHPQLQ